MGYWCNYAGADARTFNALTGTFSAHYWDWCNADGSVYGRYIYDYSTGELRSAGSSMPIYMAS